MNKYVRDWSGSSSFLISVGNDVKRVEEEYIRDHVLCYILSGSLHMSYVDKEIIYPAGTTLLMKRNHLVKCEKRPDATGEYKVISLILSRDFLQDYLLYKQPIPVTGKSTLPSLLTLTPAPPLEALLQSLTVYAQQLYQPDEALIQLKQKEAVLSLTTQDPQLFYWLFAEEPKVKLDLLKFMERNFRYNIPISKFAELTGRSLSTFQRDFLQAFGMNASTWLRKRRLQAAHQLLQENNKASDIYLSLGFEDLSHFSRSFKKEFNVSPSLIKGHIQ